MNATSKVLPSNRRKFPGNGHTPRSIWFSADDPFDAFLEWLVIRQGADLGEWAKDLTDAQRFDIWVESWARGIRKEFDQRPRNGKATGWRNHEARRIETWRRCEIGYWVSVCELTGKRPPRWLDDMRLEAERCKR